MFELPLNQNPPLRCYLNEVHALGIIFTQNYDMCLPWLSNRYYSFEMRDINGPCLRHAPYEWWFTADTVFTTFSMGYPLNILTEKEMCSIICRMMKSGYYCAGDFNEKYRRM
jgi:hypothetical protein